MVSKCPPGVVCIENVSLSYLTLSILIFAVVLYMSVSNSKSSNETVIVKENPSTSILSRQQVSQRPPNVLQDPHVPPLRDTSYEYTNDPRGVPINISTRAKDTTYRQVGILTRINGSETILPLMGRPLFTSRDKWQFYTMSDQNNSIKLPISNGGKSCTGEYGCDNLSNGDTVYIEGYNDAFKVTLYDDNTIKYIPYI